MEEVLHEQDPEQVVEVVLVDGEVAVARAAHGSGDVVEGDRNRERDDVDPRRHHLPGGGVAHRLEPLADLQLLLGDLRRRLVAVPSSLATELHLPWSAASRRARGQRRGEAACRTRHGTSRLRGPPRTARRIRIGSSGLTSQPSAADRAGEEHVRPAVEQDHDRHVRDPAAGLLEVEVEADRHPAHVADLQVGDHEIGRVLLDGGPHLLAGAQLADLGLVVLERRPQLLEDRVGVTDDQHELPPPETSWPPSRWRATIAKPFEIVHVLLQKRNPYHRSRRDLAEPARRRTAPRAWRPRGIPSRFRRSSS